MIVVNSFFFYREYVGLAIWPFIFLRDGHLKADKVLLNHERIHLRQQRELLILPFYMLYLTEWIVRYLYYNMDSYKAYRNLSFEREAYVNEGNLQYLEKRKSFGFIGYL